jgi:hypothetical protein
MTRAPLTFAGAHSEAYIGIVALFGPMPSPRRNLKVNMICQFHEKACPRQKLAEKIQAKNIVPRLPKTSFRGCVSLYCNQVSTYACHTTTSIYTDQQLKAEQRYGALFTKPIRVSLRRNMGGLALLLVVYLRPKAYW